MVRFKSVLSYHGGSYWLFVARRFLRSGLRKALYLHVRRNWFPANSDGTAATKYSNTTTRSSETVAWSSIMIVATEWMTSEDVRHG